jgi:hypothetical protein
MAARRRSISAAPASTNQNGTGPVDLGAVDELVVLAVAVVVVTSRVHEDVDWCGLEPGLAPLRSCPPSRP